jgi:hypothetical protein
MQWPKTQCVLKRIPWNLPYVKVQGRELLVYMRTLLLSGIEICTFHQVVYFAETVLLKVILRHVPDPSRIYPEKTSEVYVSVSILCEDLGILNDHSLWVFALSDFWRIAQRGDLELSIIKRLALRSFGTKKYVDCLKSKLNMFSVCARGLYKLTLSCDHCAVGHRILVPKLQE